MRLYLPATIEALAALQSDGAMGVGDDVVVAVGDSEDEEYDALMTAAESAAELAAELEPGERRRVVVVAELAATGLPTTVTLADVVAVHADPRRRTRRRSRPRRRPRLVRHAGDRRPPPLRQRRRPPRPGPPAAVRPEWELSALGLSDSIADMDAVTHPPQPLNEPNLTYAPGSAERDALLAELVRQERRQVSLRAHIGGRRRNGGGAEIKVVQPHDHQHVLGVMKNSTTRDAEAAIKAAQDAAPGWRALSFDDRAADHPQGRRPARRSRGAQRLNAATMLGQSKTAFQAEIDAACELIDFWRFNVHFARQILAEQPIANSPGIWNRSDYRPARGLRLRDHAVQLHRDRRQPADGPGADGQHGGLEAEPDPAGRGAASPWSCSRRPACRRA